MPGLLREQVAGWQPGCTYACLGGGIPCYILTSERRINHFLFLTPSTNVKVFKPRLLKMYDLLGGQHRADMTRLMRQSRSLFSASLGLLIIIFLLLLELFTFELLL